MTKRNAEMFTYDPEKTYNIANFENTTIKNLYAIGKQVGLRDVKKPKKDSNKREFFKLDIDEIIKTVDTVCSMYC